MRQFARDEFDRNRDVYDIQHIRYLISVRFIALLGNHSTWLLTWDQTGRTQFDGMKRYVYEQAV